MSGGPPVEAVGEGGGGAHNTTVGLCADGECERLCLLDEFLSPP